LTPATRSHLNVSLLDTPDTPEGVVEHANKLMAEKGFKPERVDACIAAEGVFSLRERPTAFDMFAYFAESARWLEKRLGGQLLSADVHLDQSHPHCHVLVLLPLVNGGPSGSSLIEYKHESGRRVQAFFEDVASRYGLHLPPPAISAANKKLLARLVHERMYATGDPATQSAAWPRFSNCVNRDPRGFAMDLGIPIQRQAATTVSLLAQSPGKGPKTAAGESAGNRRLDSAWESAGPATTPKGVAPSLSNHLGWLADRRGDGRFDPDRDQHPSRVGVASLVSNGPAAEGQHCGPAEPAVPQAPAQPLEAPVGPPQTSPEPMAAPASRRRDVEDIVYVVERDDFPADQWDSTRGERRPQPLPLPQANTGAAQAVAAELLARLKKKQKA
jgi:hypothetical protein